MTPLLRASAAHVFVADIGAPSLDHIDQHHLSRVLRLRDNEIVTASDGQGQWRTCRFSKNEITPESEVVSVPAPARRLAVAIVPIKGDRTESAVEKLVELGIHEIIILLATDHGVVRWDAQRRVHHLERLQRVARGAAMQSRRVWLPILTGPTLLADVLLRPGAAVAEPGGRSIDDRDHIIVIGPEGGFSAAELALASTTVSLGDQILRADTAAAAAATLMVAHGER